MMNLPAEFVERLKRIVPEDRFCDILASFSQPKRVAFRINSLICPRRETMAALQRLNIPCEPIAWLVDSQDEPIGYLTDREHRAQLTHSDLADSGRIYLQNPSSMLAPWLLDARPGETVLDLAAAPGGKTTQLAEQMQNTGQLSAVEAVRSRMFKLTANLKRCGVVHCKTYLTDGRTVGKKTPNRFDRVLLDAPCSSESRFRADDPVSWATWSLRKIRETSRKQIGLLKAAVHATKVGGTIVYCTCSFSPEENEAVLDKVLRRFEEAIELVPIQLPLSNQQAGLTAFENSTYDPQIANAIRILPNDRMDGFFLAKLVKKHP